MFTHSVENILTSIRIIIICLMHRGYDRCCTQRTEMCRRIGGGTALYRKVYHKDGSSAWIIGNIYLTAMQFGKLLYQVQTYSATALRLHFGTIDLIETLEHMFLLLIADSLACIRYRDAEHIRILVAYTLTECDAQRNGDKSSIWRKLISIAQEVVHDLSYLISIERHLQTRHRRIEGKRYLAVCQSTERSTDVIHEAHDVYTRQGKFLLVLVYLAEVENLVYQIEQTGSIAMNHLQLPAFTFISFFPDHINQRRDNQGERCTEFVAHIGEEVEFEFIQLLGLLDTVFLALEFEFYALLFEHTLTVEIESYTY